MIEGAESDHSSRDINGNQDVFDEEGLQKQREFRATFSLSNTPRKIRTNSYYRAVGSQADANTQRAAGRKQRIPAARARALLYQEINERGILDDTMDDEDDDSSSTTYNSSGEEKGDDVRPLWSDLPGVRSSGILINMPQKERKRQEAMYELYTSEQSYLRSLRILYDVFMTSEAIRNEATSTEYHHLFSNVQDVITCSSNFLTDLEIRFKASPDVIGDICDIILLHMSCGNFSPYITYCSNEVYQQRAFQSLTDNNPDFVRAVRAAESNPACNGLPLHSFLLLPMQRVTRVPLLIDMIRQRSDITKPSYKTASKALKEASRLVNICNERAKALGRTEEMIALQRQLEFKTRSFALVSPSRFLLKRGQLTRLYDDTILGFRKQMRQETHLFLFNDVIITGKKKADEKYVVSDFCYRHRMRMQACSEEENAFELVMERNQDGRRVVLRLQADSPSICARWIQAVRTVTKKEPKSDKACVQVRIVRPIRATESDLISLQPMDVLAVLVATPDGWYYGERLIDGRRGWFPSTHAKEILNDKARERNFKRGTRLLGIETQI